MKARGTVALIATPDKTVPADREKTMKSEFSRSDWFSRALPFAIFIAFLALGQAIAHMLPEVDARWLYGVRTACVALALLWFWRRYDELRTPVLPNWRSLAAAVAIGAAVFVAWINLDHPWIMVGSTVEGFSPLHPDSTIDWWLATMRLGGAALVVPVMEELFWRSFLMRWIDRHAFLSVAPARISTRALLISSLVFGFEHQQWFAGIVAGLAYGILYMRTGNLWAPILAHAVTNGMLGAWVLQTRNWQFW